MFLKKNPPCGFIVNLRCFPTWSQLNSIKSTKPVVRKHQRVTSSTLWEERTCMPGPSDHCNCFPVDCGLWKQGERKYDRLNMRQCTVHSQCYQGMQADLLRWVPDPPEWKVHICTSAKLSSLCKTGESCLHFWCTISFLWKRVAGCKGEAWGSHSLWAR
jgi:hypothetical protein